MEHIFPRPPQVAGNEASSPKRAPKKIGCSTADVHLSAVDEQLPESQDAREFGACDAAWGRGGTEGAVGEGGGVGHARARTAATQAPELKPSDWVNWRNR